MGVEVAHDEAVHIGEERGDARVVASGAATARRKVSINYPQVVDLDSLYFQVVICDVEIYWGEIYAVVDEEEEATAFIFGSVLPD